MLVNKTSNLQPSPVIIIGAHICLRRATRAIVQAQDNEDDRKLRR